MKTQDEIIHKLRERIHRARRKWFRKNADSGKTKQELYEEFEERIRTPEVLLKEYREITTLLWVLGEFDNRDHHELE